MRELLKPFNYARRLILRSIDKNYLKKQIKKRKGKCKKCGKCCCSCIHLDKKTKLCRVYSKRPWYCYKDFPLDGLDKKIWNVEKTCGYKFKK